MADYLTWDVNNYSSNLFKLLPGHHYIIPKPKFMYYVNFNINPLASRLTSANDVQPRLGFMVKSMDRPNIQYRHQELNQYNKKRLITTGVDYGTMSMTLHDTIDEVALKMIKDYTDHYYLDFIHGENMWRYDVSYMKDNSNIFGYNIKNGAIDMYFFTSIDVYEFYNGYYTQYSLMNPKIENLSMGNNDMSSDQGNEITISLKMEGLIWKEIAAPMTQAVADRVGLPFKTGTTGNFPLIYRKTVGTGLNLDRSLTSYNQPNLALGGMIQRSAGNIVSGIIGGVLAPAAMNFVSNTLNSAGLGLFTPLANGAVMSGARSLTSSIMGSIF